MSGRKWTIFSILTAIPLGLAGLGFGAMSINPPFMIQGWVPTIFFISAGILLVTALCYLIISMTNKFRKEKEASKHINDGTVLLQLLDDIYQEVRSVTEQTINGLRDRRWQGINRVFEDVTGIDPDEVAVAVQYWTLKGVAQFMSGEEITVDKDASELAEKIKNAIGSKKNPELLATDLTLSIRHRFLDQQLKRNRNYRNHQRLLRRERDKFPDEGVSNAVDSFLDHTFKVNAVWVVAEFDLIGISSFEKAFEYKILPGRIILRVEDVPNQAEREMERFRNKVAVNIEAYLREKTGRIVHRK